LHGFSFLRFGFAVFGYSGVSIFLPVHVRKRGDPLKPATTAHFFFRRVVSDARVKQKAATE
jgi:hypothetical protein